MSNYVVLVDYIAYKDNSPEHMFEYRTVMENKTEDVRLAARILKIVDDEAKLHHSNQLQVLNSLLIESERKRILGEYADMFEKNDPADFIYESIGVAPMSAFGTMIYNITSVRLIKIKSEEELF